MTNLTSRVSRLISGSLNAAIDAVENMSPDMVMEQAIHEVENAIREVRAELGRATADRHLNSKSLAKNSDKHEELSTQIEVAVKQGRDDLASTAIAHQIDLEKIVPKLEEAIDSAIEREKELESYVEALLAKRNEMHEELKAFQERKKEQPENTVIDAAGNPSSKHTINKSVDRASAAFDRASDHTADILGTSGKDVSQLTELKNLARSSEVEERLAAIKKKNA